MTTEKLMSIIENHKHWFNEDRDGWEEMKADLREVNLYGSDLRGVNLYRASLYGADLRWVDLSEANLYGADLRRANLYRASLYGADLRGADLSEANLNEANLTDANLYGAKNIPYIPYSCPDTGSFIGYKKQTDILSNLKFYSTLEDALPPVENVGAIRPKC